MALKARISANPASRELTTARCRRIAFINEKTGMSKRRKTHAKPTTPLVPRMMIAWLSVTERSRPVLGWYMRFRP
jgi:hypothetical protein